jgi:hypothetical protein
MIICFTNIQTLTEIVAKLTKNEKNCGFYFYSKSGELNDTVWFDNKVLLTSRLASIKKPNKNSDAKHCCQNPEFKTMIDEKYGIKTPILYWIFNELYQADSETTDLEAIGASSRCTGVEKEDCDRTTSRRFRLCRRHCGD